MGIKWGNLFNSHFILEKVLPFLTCIECLFFCAVFFGYKAFLTKQTGRHCRQRCIPAVKLLMLSLRMPKAPQVLLSLVRPKFFLDAAAKFHRGNGEGWGREV